MLYALISDVHANLEAFEAVIEDIKKVSPDRILFLGDIVGYGPNPNECLELLLKIADVTLGGNHDWAMVGKTSMDYFNPFAKASATWTEKQLKDEHKDFLSRTRSIDMFDGFQLAHSSPYNPDEWRYILSQTDAQENYPHIEGNLCFIGHSHQPIVIEFDDEGEALAYREPMMTLNPDKKYIVNVGSIGQPRDANPKACWAVYDSEIGRIEYRRVEYNINETQRKMHGHGLPRYLINRLAEGR